MNEYLDAAEKYISIFIRVQCLSLEMKNAGQKSVDQNVSVNKSCRTKSSLTNEMFALLVEGTAVKIFSHRVLRGTHNE